MKSQRGLPPPKFMANMGKPPGTIGPKVPSVESAGMSRSLLGKPPPGVQALSKPSKPVSIPKPPKGKLPD
jgi:hypothetical protein